jgi:D-glycero-D-manno-heptose 1,7-bisphosphate phosphatase
VAFAGFASGGEGGTDEVGIHGGDAVKNKAVFLDRDGVLNQAVVRNGLPHPPASAEELVLAPNAKAALEELKAQGFLLLVVTNQPDVAKGITTRAVVEAINRRVASELPIDDLFVCFHQDSDHCDCRKPKPGMLLEGARKHNVDPGESFMVGDRWRDVEAGQSAGCRTVFIDGGYEERQPARPADAQVYSLKEAADWILQACRKGVAQ